MRRRGRLNVVVATLVAAALAAAIGVFVAFVAGASIDLSRWRDVAAQRVSAALGREVVVHGPLRLTLGREIVLRAGDVRVRNLPAFVAPDAAALGEVSVRLDPFDVLRGRARLRGIQASDIGLWLEQAADGRNNWSTTPRRDPASPAVLPELGPVELKRLAVHHDDARSATHRRVEIDELRGSAGPNEALRLALRGNVDAGSYALRIEGGTLRQLQDGAEPWPVAFDLQAAGAWLHAAGVLDARQGQARVDFGAGADELARVGRLLGLVLPQWGVVKLYGRVTATAQKIELADLQAQLAGADVTGRLVLDLGASRLRLSGALAADALDLHAWQAAGSASRDSSPEGDGPGLQSLALRDLVPLDLDVGVSVGRWAGIGIDLHDTTLALRADAQGLRASGGATLGGAAFAGALRLDIAAPTAATAGTLSLEVAARELALADLSQTLWNPPGLQGRVKQLRLRAAGRGETLGALARGLEVSLALAGLQARVDRADGAGPIAVALDELRVAAGHGTALRGSARGTLQGEPVRLSVRAGSLPELLGERAMRVELDLVTAAATLRLSTLTGQRESAGDLSLGFDLQAARVGDLARWLGVAPSSELPLALRGRLRVGEAAWRLESTTVQLGRSDMTLDARHGLVDGRPLTQASVRSGMLDLPELATLSAGAAPAAGAGKRIDAPLRLAGRDLADVDLDLSLQRVVLRGLHLEGVTLRAGARDGRLLPAALAGTVADTRFTGQVGLDLRDPTPQASLDLSTGAVDLGAVLRGLGVAEDIDGRVDRLHLALDARGNSLRELAGTTTLQAGAAGGRISVLGAAGQPAAEIGLHEVGVEAAPGAPLRLRLDGTLDGTAVHVEARSGSLADFIADAPRLPFALVAQAAGTRLSLDGEVALPLGREGWLRLEVGGERLDSLDPLARVELAPWGTWSLRGPIRMTPTGYDVQDLALDVGRSRLTGSGRLDIGGPRPHLALRVTAPSIQLDDFPMPRRLYDPPRQGDGLRGAAGQLAGRIDRLLSARFLRRLDADIDVEAGEVLSGPDRLADGKLHLKLEAGRLELGPAAVNLPGGSLRMSIAYDLKESEVDFTAAAQVERFDYGIIARRLGRDGDQRGLFSLDLQLQGRAPSLDTILRHVSGRLDIAVWPTDLRSGMFDLWSANLVLRLLPLIDPGVNPQVNCIVGRFDLAEGDLRDDKMLFDTTRVRIRGSGHANLATEQLSLVFRPQAKGLGVFRLQTPLRVSGTLSDQRFGFERQDVVLSVLQLIASPVLVPIEWLRSGIPPRDGADLCTDPLRIGRH